LEDWENKGEEKALFSEDEENLPLGQRRKSW